ncbi:hypothetical protein, partial [Fibrobacter sp.]|uniref:hypothetical protein n=1 Tax=Fibrobacter sp. TaxID=35828 RepID=UPI0025C4B43F
DVSEMLSRLLAGFISLLFILVPLDVEFSFFSTKEPRFYRLKISDRLTSSIMRWKVSLSTEESFW